MPEPKNMNTSPLKSKIDEFVRKYYFNRFLQGVLIGIGGLLVFFLTAIFIEYFGHFGSGFRTVLFYSFLLFSLFVIGRYMLMPMLNRLGIGKVISHENASKLIGVHFPEIKDKLLNTLQLEAQSKGSDNELLLASIEQRINSLSPFKFSNAVDVQASAKRYGKYTLLPAIVLIGILIFQSSMITKPAKRIISYDQFFAKEAPYTFHLKSEKLKVPKNTDYLIEVELKGKSIPALLYVNLDGHLIKMENTGKNLFTYALTNLTNDHKFYFTDAEFNSMEYRLEVLPNPTLLNFKVTLDYPEYTRRKDEVLSNIGDFTIPEGTLVEWSMNTKDVEQIAFAFEKEQAKVDREGDVFRVKAKVTGNVNYSVSLQNRYLNNKDTIRYGIQVIEDRHPGIAAEQKVDSINPFIVYFYGKADDDYGISKLNFVYKAANSNGIHKYLPVNIGKGTDEIYYYMVDLRELSVKEGADIEYYFEVWDNDAINGKKSSKSQIFHTIAPSEKQMRAETESGNRSLKSKMAQVMKEFESMQKKGSDLKRELMESENLDWQQQQKLKDYISEQKKLDKKLEEIKQENDQLNEKQKQLDPLDEELLKKQEELNKLMKELLSPEMKELMKKLEEMVKQQNMQGIQQQLDKMKLNNEEIKKELDRSLEQFKQLEIEKKINEQSEALNKLSEEQRELSKKTMEKSLSNEALKQQQEELNKKFDELKKEIKETEEKNKELETPMDMESTEKDQESIDQKMEESSDDLSKKQNKKAGDKQKKAADEMEELASKMKKSLEKAQDQQNEEDYYTLRQILENLIELSVQQEDLMNKMKEYRYSNYSPKYVELSSKQQKLKESAKMVEDSLLALSKRQIQIKSFVNKEIANVNHYMDDAIIEFSKVHVARGLSNQQYVMTGLNNLALMLSESLKNMQESMKEKKGKSSSQCDNPGKKQGKKQGGAKPNGMQGLKQMQNELGKQLQQMQKAKEKGQSPGSEMYARIAAQQEAIRRELERLQKQLKEDGKPGAFGDLEKTKQLMEQQEKDLVNKQITPETMRRMQEIETRMLEHEKAEQEQDMDNEREAEQANEINKEMPPAIKEYLEKKAREMELLRSVPSELSPYYKDRVRVFFQKLGNV
ncbi:MAG: hypothetical protein IT245_03450 [Bacteroidia bacterium]|nr:hypothetical protein [Bacteroidia bacterium]